MKHTKRLFSVLLTLCLLLGILPTTVWAESALAIIQQPTADNNYTVEASYMGQPISQGFQWYKKVDTAATYTLVQENPQADQLAADEIRAGSYTNGYWEAEDEKAIISMVYLSAPGDELTITILSGGSEPSVSVGRDFYDPTEVSPGVYTFTSEGGMLDIYIANDDRTAPTTATITVKRSWTAVAGQTSASLTASESGTYYCGITYSKGGYSLEGLISDIVNVTILSPEEQATIDWLADPNVHMLALGPVEVTADNYDDIFRGVPENVASGKASFAVVNGTPTLTLDGVNVNEGYPLDVIAVGLLCSDELTIVLADGSDNNITISGKYAMGIMTGDMSIFSPLTVTGTGTLTVSASASDILCFGGYVGGIQVTGGAEFTTTASTPSDQAECIGLNIDVGGNLQVSDGGVVRISGTTAAAAFGDDTVQILADGYSIQGSTTANDFTNLADTELKKLKEDGDVFTLKVGDEFAKSVVIAPIPPHNHTWDGDWTTNDTHHWHECTAAGCPITDDAGKDSYAAHAGGTATCTDKAVCDTCGSAYGELAGHDFTGDYLSDADGHWHQCKNCTATDSKAAHAYDDDQDTTCGDCGYVRTLDPSHTHAWSGDWTTNDTHHWHACTAAGCPVTDDAQKDGYAAHTYDNDQDDTCGDCGYVRTIDPSHTHAWSGDWTTNGTHHWHACTAAGCPVTDDAQKDGYAAHTGGTATCAAKAVCDTCGSAYGELAGHDFTGDYLSDADGHWHQCKNCTATDSKAAHTYDDDQDDTCNDCGYTRTSTQPTFAISGTVTDNSDAAVSGAVVKLMQGSRQISQAATDSNGQYSFANVPAGTYNVVAEQGGGADKITKTILVVLTDSNATEKNIKMPDGQKNSVVEVKGTDTPAVVAGGVDQVAEAQSVSPGETVTVKLTVEKKTESAAAGAADIKQVASGKTLEFLDLSLVKEVTGGFGTNVTNITNTGGSVLEIVVPYDFTDKNNVTVYRHHNGAAEALTPAETGAGGTFKLSADSVIIYATKFSTYAIGYTASGGGTPDPTPPTPPSGGGSSGGSSSPATYTPVIEKSDHGKVKCTPQSPERGDKVTVTLTPDKGWQIDGLTVTDRNGKPVAVTNRGGGIYTFTQPTGRVTIKASFKPISNAVSGCSKDETCPIWSYEDASLSAWYHDGVHYCLERGLMVGTDSTHFSPGMTASRAMIASILWRMEGEPEAKTTQPFSDVADGRWYTRAVAWAAEAGVIKGYGEGRFGPNDPITREQLASILWRYAGSPPASDLPLNFTDAGEASGYARDALRWAVEQGILTGKGGGVLDPRGKASRAEVAQMLTRFCLNGK